LPETVRNVRSYLDASHLPGLEAREGST
jgi:hypothetical protein